MKPLILDFAISRKGELNVTYQYDFLKSLNTIQVENKSIVFIDSKEDDDMGLLELKTKTEAKKERDDHHHSLLELQTKTFTKTERDDESSNNIQ